MVCGRVCGGRGLGEREDDDEEGREKEGGWVEPRNTARSFGIPT